MKLNKLSLALIALLFTSATQIYAYTYSITNKTATPKKVAIYTALGPAVDFGAIQPQQTKVMDSHSPACLFSIVIIGEEHGRVEHRLAGCGDHHFNLIETAQGKPFEMFKQ